MCMLTGIIQFKIHARWCVFMINCCIGARQFVLLIFVGIVISTLWSYISSVREKRIVKRAWSLMHCSLTKISLQITVVDKYIWEDNNPYGKHCQIPFTWFPQPRATLFDNFGRFVFNKREINQQFKPSSDFFLPEGLNYANVGQHHTSWAAPHITWIIWVWLQWGRGCIS